MTIYNSRGNQIDIAQIAIYICFLQIKSNQVKCWFLVRGENGSTRAKTSHSRVENQQTQSTFDARCGNRTRATLGEGKCSHRNANPVMVLAELQKMATSPISKLWVFVIILSPFLHRTTTMWFCSRFSNVLI